VKRLLKEIEVFIKAQKEGDTKPNENQDELNPLTAAAEEETERNRFLGDFNNEPLSPFRDLNYDELGAKLEKTLLIKGGSPVKPGTAAAMGRKKNSLS
jgi:hypothetical protein